MAAKRDKQTTQTRTAKSYEAPALDKGLDVLELMARQSVALTKSEIARLLGRTVSEIFRMLVCLERRGYIAQGPDERYGLTLKLFKLVQEHPPTERLIADALPVMHRLAHETVQSCHLAVLEGGRITIVAQVNAGANQGFAVKLGSSLDLMESASGYTILAHQDDAHLARTLAAWQRETGHQPPRDLAAHLARIRKAGFEKRSSYVVKGIVNISFPILDERGSGIGALTVPFIEYNHPDVTLAQVTEALGAAAREITAGLGGKISR